ncbi:GPI ethanolamine phosphate transferase 2-like isoform X2 [Anthonomus grandis grandis]|uniref:GPI ethanolamine phosphate transferase 2-like isoform X2 n=1 Tax=Anthonomus grandis grandis TaxID=2921223 RepID=UPI002166C134|nr:GPI ethanolamine phosphate transferase 2-like isoform X2 [Anthonomus grandis grandis]
MFLYALLLLLTVVLYLQGFFPMSNPITAFNNDPPTHIGNISINTTAVYSPLVQKTVLIIIDALRYDFVTPDLMPHTMGLVTSQGCLNKVIAESPTVTLPRIKALTTGCVPQYIDVIQNLASSEALKDSWLHSAKKKGLKIVFYGDNTWEKLFPRFFDRSEGTTSFFVRDFTEVDNNVTRNVNIELEKNDWDIMILHYLGLDHIGHVLGPFSSRIKPKLQEMDLVIDQIYQKIKNVDSIIMITGDHGMRDSGVLKVPNLDDTTVGVTDETVLDVETSLMVTRKAVGHWFLSKILLLNEKKTQNMMTKTNLCGFLVCNWIQG